MFHRSFFTKSPVASKKPVVASFGSDSPKKSNGTAIEDSPIKATTKRKRVAAIESDSEDEAKPGPSSRRYFFSYFIHYLRHFFKNSSLKGTPSLKILLILLHCIFKIPHVDIFVWKFYNQSKQLPRFG